MQQFFSGPAGELMQIGAGVIPNPYIAQIFRSVNFRSFDFIFRLVPFSEKDCDTIQEIIKTFRRWALPEGPDGERSNWNVFKISR